MEKKPIFEGFFGDARKNNGPMIKTNLYKEELKDKLLDVRGSVLSPGDWGFIDDFMDGYVTASDKHELMNMINNAVGTYGDGISLNWIDVSSITDMNGLFHYSMHFNGDVSRWDTSRVTDMHGMFYGCTIFNGDISGWDTSRVTDMCFMFHHCNAFNCDISGWDVSRVTDMSWMFCDCSSFVQNLSGWDVSSVETRTAPFSQCPMPKRFWPKFKKYNKQS